MKHVDRDIERYFDGGIETPEAHEALFGHLDRCPTCRAYFDELAIGHRMLAADRSTLPSTELALLLPIVVGRSATSAHARVPSWVWSLFGPALAAMFALLFFRAPPELVSKGSVHGPKPPTIEVLCFDEKFEVTAHLERDGACPAPGWIKVVYASPWTVPSVTVGAFSGDQVRFVSRMQQPAPRAVIPEHARLEKGDELRIVVTTEDTDDKALMAHPPSITVSGVLP
jgi:hypothetical protein